MAVKPKYHMHSPLQKCMQLQDGGRSNLMTVSIRQSLLTLTHHCPHKQRDFAAGLECGLIQLELIQIGWFWLQGRTTVQRGICCMVCTSKQDSTQTHTGQQGGLSAARAQQWGLSVP